MTFYRRPPPSEMPVRPPEEDKPSYGKWLWIVLVGLALILIIKLNQPERHLVGEVAPYDPKIIVMKNAPSFNYKGYTVTPLASITMRARVLSSMYYSGDEQSDLVPYDIAVGWGKMSDSLILKTITVSQGNRWYYWTIPDFNTVSKNYIITHSRNIHILPSNYEIEKAVANVDTDDIVVMQGYLVSITKPNGYKQTSPTDASGEGAGSCFILWLEKISIQ